MLDRLLIAVVDLSRALKPSADDAVTARKMQRIVCVILLQYLVKRRTDVEILDSCFAKTVICCQ